MRDDARSSGKQNHVAVLELHVLPNEVEDPPFINTFGRFSIKQRMDPAFLAFFLNPLVRHANVKRLTSSETRLGHEAHTRSGSLQCKLRSETGGLSK